MVLNRTAYNGTSKKAFTPFFGSQDKPYAYQNSMLPYETPYQLLKSGVKV